MTEEGLRVLVTAASMVQVVGAREIAAGPAAAAPAGPTGRRSPG